MPNIKRLKLLAWYIRSIPREHFNMQIWLYHPMPFVNGRIEKVELGTLGCAIGWATQIPEFNKEGFTFDFVVNDNGAPAYEDNNDNEIGRAHV